MAALACGCGGAPSTGAPTPVVVRVALTGISTFYTTGAFQFFTATALLSDGTTSDRTGTHAALRNEHWLRHLHDEHPAALMAPDMWSAAPTGSSSV